MSNSLNRSGGWNSTSLAANRFRWAIRVMLPPFDEHGYLPPGIHECSWDELEVRFGIGSPERKVQIKELRQFLDWCRQSGIRRVIVNGSFVTAKISPIDVDVVIQPEMGQNIDSLRG